MDSGLRHFTQEDVADVSISRSGTLHQVRGPGRSNGHGFGLEKKPGQTRTCFGRPSETSD